MTIKTDPGGSDGDEQRLPDEAPSNGTARSEPTKPVTVMLPEDLLRKLKVIAVLRDRSISEVVADHVEGLVKRDLKKLLAKLDA